MPPSTPAYDHVGGATSAASRASVNSPMPLPARPARWAARIRSANEATRLTAAAAVNATSERRNASSAPGRSVKPSIAPSDSRPKATTIASTAVGTTTTAPICT